MGQVDTPSPSKPWKSYLFEGVMIFVAVSLSFLADEFRGKLQEKKRETEFMKSMIADLDRDLVSLQRMQTTYRERYIPAGDSIALFLTEFNLDQPATSLYYQLRLIIRYIPLRSTMNDRTFTQLKNSEGLGLIKQKPVLDSIQDYYQAIETIHEMEAYLFQEKQELRQLLPTLLSAEGYAQLIDERDRLVRPHGNFFVKKITEEQKNEFLVRLSDINGVSKNLNWRLGELIKKTAVVKGVIVKSYQLP
jgi:hypothetical protein